MKQSTKHRLQDIVFTVLLVLAFLALFVFFGSAFFHHVEIHVIDSSCKFDWQQYLDTYRGVI